MGEVDERVVAALQLGLEVLTNYHGHSEGGEEGATMPESAIGAMREALSLLRGGDAAFESWWSDDKRRVLDFSRAGFPPLGRECAPVDHRAAALAGWRAGREELAREPGLWNEALEAALGAVRHALDNPVGDARVGGRRRHIEEAVIAIEELKR